MRSLLWIGLFWCLGCTNHSKTNSHVVTLKDLDEIMLDLKAYHQNIGDHLKRGKLKEAEWLVDGMDSTLQLAIIKFVEHPKLSASFETFYDDLLASPLVELRLAIEQNNQSLAIKNFKALTSNCNRCHEKHEVKKRVKFNP